jgi:hypothetical protein
MVPHFKARIPALLSIIRLGWNWLALKNTLAYYNLAFIIYFKVEVEPVVKVVKAAINFALWFHVFWSKNNLPTDTLSTTCSTKRNNCLLTFDQRLIVCQENSVLFKCLLVKCLLAKCLLMNSQLVKHLLPKLFGPDVC